MAGEVPVVVEETHQLVKDCAGDQEADGCGLCIVVSPFEALEEQAQGGILPSGILVAELVV